MPRDPLDLTVHAKEYHRNGVGGLGFDVILFRDNAEGKEFVGIDFGLQADRDTGGICFAVLCLELLDDGEIGFGRNSWRGDMYAHALRDLLKDT